MFQLLALQLPILLFRLLTEKRDHLETKLSGMDTIKLVISTVMKKRW